MAIQIGSLLIRLGLESGEFKSGLSQAEKQMRRAARSIENVGKSLQGIGQKMSVAVTLPLVALGKTAVSAAMESRDALAQVEATLASMGNAAGRTSEQLQALADAQAKRSLFDDDEILRKATTTLLTFGKVSGETFDRAQQAAIDLSARLGTDLQSSAIMVGKALNDPVKGVTALTRAGVSFTAQQKEQIKAMAEVGDIAAAQAMILDELKRQFGGAATAALKANPFAALKKSFDEFQEKVGEQLLKILPNITAALGRVLDAFSGLSPGMQQAAVIAGVLAAALGPLLAVIGSAVSAMSPFLAVLGAAFGQGGLLLTAKAALAGLAAAFGPVLVPVAALAAAGALIYANWEKIVPVLREFRDTLSATLGPKLTDLMAKARAAFDEIVGSDFIQRFINLGRVIADAFGGMLPGILRALGGLIAGVASIIVDALRLVVALLSGDWSGAWRAARDICRDAVQAVMEVIGGLAQAGIGYISGLVRGIDEWMGGRLSRIWETVKQKIDAVKGWFYGLYDAVVGHSYVPDMVDGIAAQMARLDMVMTAQASKAATATADAFQEMAEEVRPLLDRLFPEAAALARFRRDASTIDRAEGVVLSADQAAEARRRLALEGRDSGFLESFLAGADRPLGDFDKIRRELAKIAGAANDNAGEIEAANVRIVKSFKDMAQDTLSALDGLSRAIKGGGFLDILSAVINLGLQLGSAGAFGKKVADRINAPKMPSPKIPAYASGTAFHPGGLALVGERGPEIVNLRRGAQVIPNHALAPAQVQIVPSPYFDAVVDGRIQRAAPAIASAGAEGAMRRMTYARQRSLR